MSVTLPEGQASRAATTPGTTPGTIPSTAAPAASGRGRSARLGSALLLAVAAGALFEHYTGIALAGHLAIGALLAFCLVGQGFFRLRERLLLTVAAGLTVLALALDSGAAASIHRALDRGAFLAAFMLLLGVLKDAAATSPAVIASGRYLTRQPPNRRYAAISGGSHLLTALLNISALSLLAPLIQAGVRSSREAGDPEWIADIKERRQFSATLRGFALAIVWAPTTVTQALLATLLPGADAVRVVLIGLGFALTAMVLGGIEDTLRWARVRRRLTREGRRPVYGRVLAPRSALRDFALVCAALVGLTVAVREVFGVAIVPALMLAAPVLTLAWIFHQNRGRGVGGALAVCRARGADILSRSIPASSPEAITLAAAGYIGMMLAALVPSDFVVLIATPLHPVVLLAALPLCIVAAVQFALTPIVTAVFLGTALGSLEPLPADPTLMLLALAGGWALALTASPFAAGALVLHRLTGLSAARLTWHWNGLYSLLAYLLLVAWLAALHAAG